MYITNVEKVADGPEGYPCACLCQCTCQTYPDMSTIGYHNVEGIYYEEVIG
jgi:hypothetical protein